MTARALHGTSLLRAFAPKVGALPSVAPPGGRPASRPARPTRGGRVVVELPGDDAPEPGEHPRALGESTPPRERAISASWAWALDRATRPPGPWRVTIVRRGPRRLDDDNATGSGQARSDHVARWLGVDDGDEAAVRFVVEQERAPGYGVRIVILHAAKRCGRERGLPERYHLPS